MTESDESVAKCANHVRALREERMLSREELAQKAGISLRTIWSVETGHDCRLDTKRAILRALGIPRTRFRTVFPSQAASPAGTFAPAVVHAAPSA